MRLLFSFCLIVCYSTINAQTTVTNTGGDWSVQINDKPFEIKGATFGYDSDTANYDKYFEELQWMGVNSIRTWGTTSSTPLLLDAAHRHGIKVMLGIWMRHGRPGMEADDSFNYLTDTEGKTKMYDDAIETVEKYKDHPALLMWGIGNEVYLNMATDEEKKVYSKLLEKICKKVKKLDPNHPIASVEAWTFGIDWWEKYVPSLDVYGINTYGGGSSVIDQELIKLGAKKPYVITEYGVTGEWDLQKDKNGVVREPSDQEKYSAIANGYNDWIKPKPTCLGVYVFHYSDDFTHLAPWLLTHVNGKKRPQYWAIREAYTGEKPLNNIPSIKTFKITGTSFEGEDWQPVELEVEDNENDDLFVNFYYNHREGSRVRRDQILPLPSRGNLNSGFEIKLPKENGGVKIYAMVSDSYDNLGIS
ncbi:MAG: glycoside hydrolase family 2 TIM barrel-domain containing protein, partial [Bacteroidota bacterium]